MFIQSFQCNQTFYDSLFSDQQTKKLSNLPTKKKTTTKTTAIVWVNNEQHTNERQKNDFLTHHDHTNNNNNNNKRHITLHDSTRTIGRVCLTGSHMGSTAI